MKKSCCIDDVNKTPRSSSGSMLLRSACSHGHSHKYSVTSRTHKQETNNQQKLIKHLNQDITESDSSESSLKFNSYLHSSLKQLAYKSAKTYSVLKEGLYNHLELSGIQSYKIVNGDEACTRFEKLHCNPVSTNSFLNNNSISQKECNFINNNYISTTSYSEIMSKSREFSRRSLSNSNALSESESEDSILKEKLRKRRSNRSLTRSTIGETESLMNNNSNHITKKGSPASYKTARTSLERIPPAQGSFMSTSNVNYQTPQSSYMHRSELSYSPGSDGSNFSHSEIDISTVQYSPVDKFRWFLWRSIYLKIIKCVNFDVWILSRLQKYKKLMVLLFLLPLLMYLLFGAIIDDSVQKSPVDLSSNIISLSSYIYSSISNPFIHVKEVFSESSSEESSCSKNFSDVLHVLYLTISNFFSNIVKKISEMLSVGSAPMSPEKNIKISSNKDEIKSVAVEVLEEKLNDIIIKIQTSQFEKNAQNKREDNIRNLKDEIANLRHEFKSLMESVQKLEKNIVEKSEGSSLKYSGVLEDQSAHISTINTKLENFEEKLSSMNGIIKNCCDEKLSISDFPASFEKYFLAALKNVVEGNKNKNTPYYFFNEWLHSKLTNDKIKLSEELKFEFEKLKEEQKFSDMKYEEKSKILMENLLTRYLESVKENLTSVNNIALSEESSSYSLDVVRKIVKEAIMLYDADKTGLVDYALESGGGSVLSTRCSESYAERDGTISVLGFPLWTTHNSPRTAIQPNMQPGQCWAFKGSHGFLVIQLSYTIHPTGFTLEHIPVSLSPSGSIDSAPKDFSVWGLVSEKDNEGKLLGKYTYDQNGDPLQYFAVQNTYGEPFSFVELKILSNHGNLEYTCLYRFRVHGKQVKQHSTS